MAGNGPDEYYPKRVKKAIQRQRSRKDGPRFTVVGAPSDDISSINLNILRLRYSDRVLREGIDRAIAARASAHDFIRRAGVDLIGGVIFDPNGQAIRPAVKPQFDFIIDQTGLDKPDIARTLNGIDDEGFYVRIQEDPYGIRVGQYDALNNIFIGGCGTTFQRAEFPGEFNIIAPVLRANENIVALWAWINFLRRQTWLIAKQLGLPDEDQLERLALYRDIQPGVKLNVRRATL